MISKIKSIFSKKPSSKVPAYAGVSDFLARAPEKKSVGLLREAARLANEDQMRTFTEARLKARAN